MTTFDSQRDILSLLRKLWGHLTSRRRLQLFIVVGHACHWFSRAGVTGGSLPFLAVLTNPDKLWQQPGSVARPNPRL